MTRLRRNARALLLVPVLAGCAHVAPYERGRLAHPTMTTGDVAGTAEAHEREVHEGAMGGTTGVGGGCGCN